MNSLASRPAARRHPSRRPASVGRPSFDRPLRDADHERVAEAIEWVRWEVLAVVPPAVVRRVGLEECVAEALLFVVRAAGRYDPVAHPGVPFAAYARNGLRLVLRSMFGRKKYRTARTWLTMPVDADGAFFLEPADHRPPDVHPALREWCSEECRAQRRCLDWRARLVLCLRCVEGLTLDDVGGVLGITRERVRHLEERAVAKLAAFRVRRRTELAFAGEVAS